MKYHSAIFILQILIIFLMLTEISKFSLQHVIIDDMFILLICAHLLLSFSSTFLCLILSNIANALVFDTPELDFFFFVLHSQIFTSVNYVIIK